MNKVKLLAQNFFVYGLGGIASKVIPLVMVPVLTRIMPGTVYFGVSDMVSTLISFCSAFAAFGMYDALFRLFFDQQAETDKKVVCSTALFFTACSAAAVSVGLVLLQKPVAAFFLSDKKYSALIYIAASSTFVNATNSIVAAPTRMQNKRTVFLVTNVMSSVLLYGIALILLVKRYYLVAIPLAGLISGGLMEMGFWIMNRKWFMVRYFNKRILKELFLIGVPCVFGLLVYWIFNSCDKVMITNMLGMDEMGIYSVSSKIGHISQLIYTAFAGGWQYYAFATMKEKNQVESNSKIFEYLGVLSFCAFVLLSACSYWIFKILFPKEYLSGYRCVPYLFLAPLLQMLYQVIGNQFMIIKKTWPSTLILLFGAMLNVLLNSMLIPRYGIEGAAVSTLVGFISINVICFGVLKRMGLVVGSKKMLAAAFLTFLYIIVWRLCIAETAIAALFAAFIFMYLIFVIYKKETMLFWYSIKKSK